MNGEGSKGNANSLVLAVPLGSRPCTRFILQTPMKVPNGTLWTIRTWAWTSGLYLSAFRTVQPPTSPVEYLYLYSVLDICTCYHVEYST